ncbi:MAG TPA: hypothetical protein PLI62_00285 [Spirochaetota bacterium]|nr:hypothetical protein [Spirochaetota bacterium]
MEQEIGQIIEPRYVFHAINDRIRHIAHPVGVEVGVHRGYFSSRMLALHHGLTLYMVDAWHPMAYEGKGNDAASPESRDNYQAKCDENYAAAQDAVKDFSGRFRIIRKFSSLASLLFDDGEFDFVSLTLHMMKIALKKMGYYGSQKSSPAAIYADTITAFTMA